jgi:hypothetical protein
MKQSSNKKQQETQKNIVESVKQSHSINRHGKDCYKVKKENTWSKTKPKSTYRDMRVSSVSLGIGGREDSVDKNKGTDYLRTKAITLGVSMVHNISSATLKLVVVASLETLHYTSTTDCTKALHDDVKHSPCQRELPCQKQPKGHSWVDVST